MTVVAQLLAVKTNSLFFVSCFYCRYGLDQVDSGGPNGSPEMNQIGNALPVQSVLVVLINNYLLLLNQPPNNIDNPNRMHEQDQNHICAQPIDQIHYNQIRRLCVSADGHLLHVQHVVTKKEDTATVDEDPPLMTRTFAFRLPEEGTRLYIECMRHLRFYRYSRMASGAAAAGAAAGGGGGGGGGGQSSISATVIGGGGPVAVPMFEHDITTELGVL